MDFNNEGHRDKVKIRKAHPNDIKSVMGIEAEASAQWKRDFFEKELKTDFSIFLVAEIDNKIIGFAIAWNIPGEIQLQNIAVDRNFRRKGTGTRLMESICSILKDELPEKMLLELKASNAQAEEFYLSQGFKKTGIRKNYYRNGEDAILMENKIK